MNENLELQMMVIHWEFGQSIMSIDMCYICLYTVHVCYFPSKLVLVCHCLIHVNDVGHSTLLHKATHC